jgi:hypothetical protein
VSRRATISPCAASSPLLSASGFKDLTDSYTQGTPLKPFLKGAYLTSDGSKCVVSCSRTTTSTKAPNLPASPDSLLPLQDVFLAVANTSGSPLEKNLATFIYLGTYEAAAQRILDLEQAAADTQARFAQLITNAEQHKVSSSLQCMQKQAVLCSTQ